MRFLVSWCRRRRSLWSDFFRYHFLRYMHTHTLTHSPPPHTHTHYRKVSLTSYVLRCLGLWRAYHVSQETQWRRGPTLSHWKPWRCRTLSLHPWLERYVDRSFGCLHIPQTICHDDSTHVYTHAHTHEHELSDEQCHKQSCHVLNTHMYVKKHHKYWELLVAIMQFIHNAYWKWDPTTFKGACYEDMRQVCIYYTHTELRVPPPSPPTQVKEVYVKENDSIGEDEVILEFYPEQDWPHPL